MTEDKIRKYLTADGHLEYGFSEKKYQPAGKYYVKVGRCSRTPETPMEEAVKAAKLIGERKDIKLCLSGGVDSEAMARAFLEAKVPFEAIIMRFNDGYNDHDIVDAVRFCEDKKIMFHYYDLDVVDFYEKQKHLPYARDYRCISPQLCVYLHFLEQIEGTPVFAGNPLFPYRDDEGRVFLACPSDLFFCFHRFFEKKKKFGVGHFFLYTPELIFSFLRLESMQKMLFDSESVLQKFDRPYNTKCDIYREGGFAVENREDKFTGFEKVKGYFAEKYGRPVTDGIYDRLFRFPLEELFPKASEENLLLPKDYLVKDA